jgi:membrane-bound ClpP family serine protease
VDQVVQVVGALLILAAFAAAQFDKLDVESKTYLWLNLVGSAILFALALDASQWGFVLLEGVWAIVSAAGLLRRPRGAPAH